MAVENLTKACSHCHWQLPILCFYVYLNKGRRRWYFTARCKDCTILLANLRYKEKREDVLRVVTAYRLTHKTEIYLLNKSYRERNKETLRKSKSEYGKRDDVLARNRMRCREARRANPDHYNELARKQSRKYPERRRVVSAKDRLRRRTAKGLCSLVQWLAKCEYFGWRCYLCGIALTSEITHMEHRKPLSRGGSHWPANLAPACQRCNLSKNNKTESEFRLLTKQRQPTA